MEMGGRIAREMARNDGVLDRSTVLSLGATPRFIKTRLRNGEWVLLGDGVYANSASPPTWERRVRAAVIGRERAYVAGRSAAFLHGFPGVKRTRPEILVPYGGNNRSRMARVIRSRLFDQVATTNVRGFECTSVAETILTLSMTDPPSMIERWVDDQLASRSLVIPDFHPILERLEFARQPGLKSLRRIVGSRADDAYQPPTTELERLLYRLLGRPELPPYVRQLPIEYPTMTAIVDGYIPLWALIAEGDGRRWHNRQADHEKDRRRDAEALAAGLAVVRFTWRMLRYEPERCLQKLLEIGRHREGIQA